jgi:hypothetical protein
MEGPAIRKILVAIGMIVLIAGTALALVYVEEPQTVVLDVDTWDVWPTTLNPPPDEWHRTFWGILMQRSWWFQLNFSSSATIRVTISILQGGGEAQWMIPIFDQVGTSFTHKVVTGDIGTYQVDIKNEGTTAVDVSGKITAREEATQSQTIHPYAIPGTFTALAGAALLIFGVLGKRGNRSRSVKERVKEKSVR